MAALGQGKEEAGRSACGQADQQRTGLVLTLSWSSPQPCPGHLFTMGAVPSLYKGCTAQLLATSLPHKAQEGLETLGLGTCMSFVPSLVSSLSQKLMLSHFQFFSFLKVPHYGPLDSSLSEGHIAVHRERCGTPWWLARFCCSLLPLIRPVCLCWPVVQTHLVTHTCSHCRLHLRAKLCVPHLLCLV